MSTTDLNDLLRTDWERYGHLTGFYSLRDYVVATSRPYGGAVVGSTTITGQELIDVRFKDVQTATSWLASHDNSGFEYLNDPDLIGDLRDPVRSLTEPATLTVTARFRPRK